ncbi:transporter substrate-binding domain-containing protein [Paractinoplanes brasiliensis]|uniref:Amino acid ABC transporter substrate-binding protein (PAAT family) n=1 Tax=Paractinoplanes brasiliensis TaxID=52695 RepID=A0A4R6JKP1_9ACTN|nr:transporter substrate-binding domain-containing protein [Actinoplanes brasiliensis]TDO36830.1 amino acid ABC transporter substrate-binding protein (PAAT family) [Actinoplanes brasiliensis]GID30347.1 amino acid ABC transporter [Actinoplanes brasiliensis]
MRLSRSPLFLIALTAIVAGCSTPTDDVASPAAEAPSAAVDSSLAGELPDAIKSSKQISLGALWETPPVISVTTTNTSTPVGIAPDLAAAIAPVLGVKVVWKNMQWPAQLPGVQSGSVDALWGQVSATEEREKSVVDLVPFYKSTMALLMLGDKASGVTGLAGMCGKKVGLPVGSIQSQTVKKVSAESCSADPIQLAEYSGATAAISAVRAGTVDAWMDSTTSQEATVKKSGSAFRVVEVPTSEFAAQYTTIAIGKSQPGLTRAVLGAMKKIVADGTYDKIMAKYDMSSAAITSDELVANPVSKTAVGEKAAS